LRWQRYGNISYEARDLGGAVIQNENMKHPGRTKTIRFKEKL